MNTENNYAPFSNHEVQKAMTIIFDDLLRLGKVISKDNIIKGITRYSIEYDGVRYTLYLDRAHKCTSITIVD